MGFCKSMRKDWHVCTWRGLAASSWPVWWKGRLCSSPLSSSGKAVGVAFRILSIPKECAGLQQAPAAGRGVGCGLGPVLTMGGKPGRALVRQAWAEANFEVELAESPRHSCPLA